MPFAEEGLSLRADGQGGFGRGRGSRLGHGIALHCRQQRIHVGQLRRIGDAVLEGEVFDAVLVLERGFAGVLHISAQIDRLKAQAVGEHVVAQAAHAVDEDHLAQIGAALERAVRQVFNGRVADHRLQCIAVAEGIGGNLRVVLRNHHGNHRQFYIVVVAVSGAVHHAAADHRQLYTVDLAGQDQVELVALIGVQAAVLLVVPEIVARQGLIGHLHKATLRLALAGNGIVPGATDQCGQLPHLRAGGIGGDVDFIDACQHIGHVLRQNGRVAAHGELLQPCAALQSAGTDAGQGSGQGQFRDAGAALERAGADGGQRFGQGQLRDAGAAFQSARADGGQRFGQGQFGDVCAVAEGLVADFGDGAEQLHVFHAAVGEGLRADGGEPAAVVGIEGADGLIALEQAVAQCGDFDLIVDCPHSQVGLAAVVDRPHAVFDGGDFRLVHREFRHAGAVGVVDPHGTVGALVLQQLCVGVAVFKGAVPGQIQVGHIRFDERIRRDVDGRVEVEDQVVQRGAREGAGADGLHIAAQVQLLAPGALEGAFADGLHRFGEGEDGRLVVLERPRTDLLQTLAPVNPADLRAEERVVADGLQRGGELHIGETAGVRECARVDALQAFGEHDAIDGIVAPEGVFGDGLHRHAADGLRDFHVGVILAIAGDRAGGCVEHKPILIVFLFGDGSALAAGLEVVRRAIGILQRGRVGVQLVVGHVDHIILRHHEEAPFRADEHRAGALKADLFQICAVGEGAFHDAHAGRNGHAGQRVAAGKAAAEVLHAVVQRHLGQAIHRGDDATLEGAQRIGHRQGSDFVLLVKGIVFNGVDQIAVHLGGDRHIAAQVAVQLQIHVVVVIRPLRLLRQRGHAGQQKQRQKQSNDSLCQKRFLLLIVGIVINSVLVH